MRAMAQVERFFERLVERPTARLFRTRLQSVQVLRRIERAMESERGLGGDADRVPSRFIVRINPRDRASLEPLDRTAEELASGALAFARARRFVLDERPRVAIHVDPRCRAREVDVETHESERRPVARSRPGSADPDREHRARVGPAEPDENAGTSGATRVYQVAATPAPRVVLEVREPGRPPRRVAVDHLPLAIGRSRESDLVLADDRVSRLHARLAGRGGVLVLTDLGSTNGTMVGGQRVREVVLGDGDRIEIGRTLLVVGRAADAEPASG